MKYNAISVSAPPEILKRKKGGEYFKPITVTVDSSATSTVVKAGSPLDANGAVANDATAVGILLNDVDTAVDPNGSLVVADAVINKTNAEANANISLTTVCREALSKLVFED